MINYDRGLCSGAAILRRAAHDRADRAAAERKNPHPSARARRLLPPAAQPRRAGLTACGGRRGRLRAAGLRRLRHGALSAARRLPVCLSAAPALASQSTARGEVIAETTIRAQHRPLFPRAHALADRHGAARLRAHRSSRTCTATCPSAGARAAWSRRSTRAARRSLMALPRTGYAEHGRRSDICAN